MSGLEEDDFHQKFVQLTEPYRRELRVHCYRMLGSLHDAEDLVQETYLRAWRKYRENVVVDSYRPWLYKIATNASLDLLRKRKRRLLIQPDVAMGEPLPANLVLDESQWLEPFPDKLLPETAANPEAAYMLQESISLAFMTALQKLSPQHRAVLILRDVLGWKAREVADHLEMSESAVNSAILRARQGIQNQPIKYQTDPAIVENYLSRYVSAWENRDVAGLISLLKENVVMSMPPMPLWLAGRDPVAGFIQQLPLAAGSGDWRMMQIGINGQPGVGAYQRLSADSVYQFMGVIALNIEPDGIARIDHFLAGPIPDMPEPLKPKWASLFELPETLPA